MVTSSERATAKAIIVKTVVTHTVTYVCMGVVAFVVFDYPRLYAETSFKYIMRQIMAKTKSTTEIVFKVALKGRRVWRTIALRGDHTLEQLHGEIFAAFNRFDDHLYSFYFPKAPRRRGPEVHPKEYVAPVSFHASGSGDRTFNAASTSLDALKLRVGQTFEYLFDYGDCWWHQIAVEHIGPIGEGCRHPVLIEKHGQSPRQYVDAE